MTWADQLPGAASPLATVTMLLGLGVLAVAAARALRVSPIVGYLALGLCLKAIGFPLEGPLVGVLADVGVALLLFETGLHFSVSHLRAHAGDIFGLGPLQVVAGASALGGVAWLGGLSFGSAVLVGLTLALSSTAVVARLIAERHQQGCPVGLTTTSILVFQDIVAIFLLIVGMAPGGGNGVALAVVAALGKAALAFVVAAFLARFIARRLLDALARTRQEEVLTAAVLCLALTAGLATEAVGLSLTLGAFLGGVMLSDTPYRVIVEAEVRPFRGLLLGFFFLSVGLSLDPSALIRDGLVIATLVIGLLAIKSATNVASSLAFRWSVPGSVQLGILIAQGSEFAFVIFALPGVRNVVDERVASDLTAAVAISLALTPNLAELGRRLAGRLRVRRPDVRDFTPSGRSEPVIIGGMGRVGRTVADALTAFEIGYMALERDPAKLRDAVADGYLATLGDLSDPRIWAPVTTDGRRIAVLTAPDAAHSQALDLVVRDRFPEVMRLAVTRDQATADRYHALGIASVLEAEESGGLEAATRVLRLLGIDEAAVAAWRATSQNHRNQPAADQMAA